MQGPKIRIAKFRDSRINLEPGSNFTLDVSLPPSDGTEQAVGVDYTQLAQDVTPGDILLDIKAIVALTESGSTPLWMSRIRTAIPIFGLSRHTVSLGKMTLYRNVYPVKFDVTRYSRDEIKRRAIGVLESRGLLNSGDMAIITKGDQDGVLGVTNALKIVQVGRVV